MKKEIKRTLAPEDVRRINDALSRDQRVELIPTREGVKVFRVRRDEVKER